MKQAFKEIFQDEPFAFQLEVAQCLLEGKRVILRAPTGAGKTRAALFPFLYARIKNLSFPRQMLYSLPLRTLANSLYQDTCDVCEKDLGGNILPPNVTIQTGEQPEDPQFREGDIMFATYDQSLSSFLTIPVGLSRREGNINAGAVISSYLVFDEFHLMETNRSLTTMTVMLSWLKEWTPFLLMTATLSETMARRLGVILDATVITVSESDLKSIPSQRNKTRIFKVEKKILTAQDVLTCHQNRSIAVCNTVDRAQTLFEQVRQEVERQGLNHETVLLHSRFLPEDRKAIEEKIRIWFGKQPTLRRNAILIATQAIEVGLDLTCEHLHTEIAPMATIVQRAGRCARFPDESGVVHIYDVPENEVGGKSYLPYDGEGEPKVCPITWQALQSKRIDGKVVGFRSEQALIRLVYNRLDKASLTDESLKSRRSEIAGTTGVWTTQERASYRDLVRFVDSRSFFVHPAPDSIENPFQFQTFSVSPGTLAHWHKEFSSSFDTDWFARLVVEDKKNANEEDEQAQRYTPPTYRYPSVERSKEFYTEYFFIIHPQYVDYSPTIGLRFRKDGKPPDILTKPLKKRERFSTNYSLETYQEHIERVWKAYIRIFGERGRFDYIAKFLEKRYGIAFIRLIRATIAGHDIGKLDNDWQEWVRIWQRDYKDLPFAPQEYYAHTDYEESTDKKKQAHLNARLSRPPHAAEGAETICEILHMMFQESQEMAQSAYTAIVRHHSPGASKVHAYRISDRAQKEVARVFELVTCETWQPSWTALLRERAQNLAHQPIADFLTKPDGITNAAFLTYLLLVRALRISDQQSLAPTNETEA